MLSSLPNLQSGKENQDFPMKSVVWSGKSGCPFQIGGLVRKIEIPLPNRLSGKENQDFLPSRPSGKEIYISLPNRPSGHKGLPYQIGRLVRKIKMSLPNQLRGEENYYFLTKPSVW